MTIAAILIVVFRQDGMILCNDWLFGLRYRPEEPKLNKPLGGVFASNAQKRPARGCMGQRLKRLPECVVYNRNLMVNKTFLKVYGDFFAIDSKRYFTVLEKGESFELEFVGCNSVYHVTSYLFRGILAPVI